MKNAYTRSDCIKSATAIVERYTISQVTFPESARKTYDYSPQEHYSTSMSDERALRPALCAQAGLSLVDVPAFVTGELA